MTGKELLIQQTQYAFSGSPVLSFKSALEGLTRDESEWKLSRNTMTIKEIIDHVAGFKLRSCIQEFCKLELEPTKTARDLDESIKFLDISHQELVSCIAKCPEQDMANSIKMEIPLEKTSDLISVLVMHDVSHAAQIRTIRRAYSER